MKYAFLLEKYLQKPLNILKSILGSSDAEVKIDYNDSNATFSYESYILTCRLIDGKYPNYEAVIPKENPNKLIIDRNLFLSSVRRVALFANKTTHQIRLKLSKLTNTTQKRLRKAYFFATVFFTKAQVRAIPKATM